jgi:hypothetical protein
MCADECGVVWPYLLDVGDAKDGVAPTSGDLETLRAEFAAVVEERCRRSCNDLQRCDHCKTCQSAFNNADVTLAADATPVLSVAVSDGDCAPVAVGVNELARRDGTVSDENDGGGAVVSER